MRLCVSAASDRARGQPECYVGGDARTREDINACGRCEEGDSQVRTDRDERDVWARHRVGNSRGAIEDLDIAFDLRGTEQIAVVLQGMM